MDNNKRDEDLFKLVIKMRNSHMKNAGTLRLSKEESKIFKKENNMIELTDKEIQSLIDARKVCKDLQYWYTMTRLDFILEEIYPGWISHLDDEGC